MPHRAVGEAVVVRGERAGDQAAIRAVHRAAFTRPQEGALVDALRGTAAWVPGLSLVAETGAGAVGHVLLSRVELRGDEPGEALALAPIGVLPEWQRLGVGGRLIRAAIEAARRGRHPLVVVLGHAAYYPRFGFSPARPQGVDPPFDVPDDVWMALDLTGEGRHPRGTVLLPPPFSAV